MDNADVGIVVVYEQVACRSDKVEYSVDNREHEARNKDKFKCKLDRIFLELLADNSNTVVQKEFLTKRSQFEGIVEETTECTCLKEPSPK